MQESNRNHVEVTEDQFLTKLDHYAHKIAKHEGYTDYNVVKRRIATEGGSYMGSLYEMDIKGKTKDFPKETNVFIKHIIQVKVELIYDIPTVYRREHFVYSNVCKHFDEIQEEKNVPVEERYRFPKAFEECTDETIILENLTAQCFKTHSRTEVVNLHYAELVVKNLARLHGLSFAIEKLRPDYFEKNIKGLDCIFLFDEKWHGFKRNIFDLASSFINEYVGEEVLGRLYNIVNKYPVYMRDSSCTRTICHGDYRHSNIMVKEVNGKPSEVIAVDYQIINFGNPILDFIYFIFWGTDQEFRRKHLNNLKELYYQHMATFLKHFDIDIEDVFPRMEFDKQYKDKLDFGLIISVIYLPFLFPPEDNVVDFKKIEVPIEEMAFKVDDKYRERFRGIFNDFVEWGYL